MSLPPRGKILALDLGQRRTGLSISDEAQNIAFIRDEIEHKTETELLNEIFQIVSEEQIKGLIIGNPLGMQGQKTQQTEWNQSIVEKLRVLELPMLLIDERLSSMGRRDSEAAQELLNTYFKNPREE